MHNGEPIEEELLAYIHKQTKDWPYDIIAVDQVIVMYSYVDSDGDAGWNYHVRGDDRVVTTVGLLESAKFRLMSTFIKTGLDQADDE